MSNFKLNLPTDIPWERLCVSGDMMAKDLCSNNLPLKWKSSMAVFGYEPPEEFQLYDNSIISYLKVSFTITNYVPDTEEAGIDSIDIDSFSTEEINDFLLNPESFPCYGAILQISIGPKDDSVNIKDYPYFMDFEPKKREVYELVSDSNERLSRSIQTVNVQKGITTTDSQELLDIFGGASANVQVAGIGGGASVTGQWGSKNMSNKEEAKISNSDNSQEKRENYSHTTQLSQMYHEFLSYHVGTNRAVFMMLPRPHTKTSDLTYINGPIQLQGIQDIFLVVNRPKNNKEICVEALLETAHITIIKPEDSEEPNSSFTRIEESALFNYENMAKAEERDNTKLKDNITVPVTLVEEYIPPLDYKIDLSKGTGGHEAVRGFDIVDETGQRFDAARITVTEDKLTVWSKVSWRFWETGVWNLDNMEDGFFNLTLKIYLYKIEEQEQDLESTEKDQLVLFLTGRNLCCCPSANNKENTGLVFENHIPNTGLKLPIGTKTDKRIQESNRLVKYIKGEMIKSLNSSQRNKLGKVPFLYSDVAFKQLSFRAGKLGYQDLSMIPGLSKDILENFKGCEIKDLCEIDIKSLRKKTNLSKDQIIDTRSKILNYLSNPSKSKSSK